MKSTTFILALLCSLFSNSQSKQLQPGDTIPAVILKSLTTLQNPASSIQHLESSLIDSSTNRHIGTSPNQLIILDFWATWCGSCIKSFPKVDSLQQQFKEQLQFILVSSKPTGDNSAKVKALFEKRKQKNGNPWCFTQITDDTLLVSLFPFKSLPRYIWIKNGQLLANTSWRQLTTANITEAINTPPGQLLSFANKN
jgi:thiol-disulfide isomerase/thioredoxin